MKTISFTFFFSLLCLAVFPQPKDISGQMANQLALYYAANPGEKMIVQTDKDIYQPGEDLWFSCWYLNASQLKSSPARDEVEIRLLDSGGEIILSDKYRVGERVFCGDFSLPGNLEPGNYFITVLFPGQENIENCYFRKISIRPFYQNSLMISVKQKETFLRKGIDNEISIQAQNIIRGIAGNKKLEYIISSGKQVIDEGKLKTDDTGNATIRFRIPENAGDMPFILSVSDGKKGSVETVRLVSETDHIHVSFYPEGGTIIPEMPSKIGFYVTDQTGSPVHIEGEIRDEQGQTIYPLKTFREGFGFCVLKAARNARYCLHITKGQGRGQQFPLPQANATGSLLSVVKTDSEFLWINLAFADRQNHKISVIASQGPEIYWTSQAQVNGAGLLKVPVAGLPHGIVLLSSFSDEGFPLNQRLVCVQKNETLKIDIATDPEQPVKNDEIKLQLRLTDENGQPLHGIVRVSVSDVAFTDAQRPVLPFEAVFNTVLKNKIAPKNPGLPNENMPQLMDYLLIANEISGFDWAQVSTFKAGKPHEKLVASSFSEIVESNLKEKIKSLHQISPISVVSSVPDRYFVINGGLISKKPAKNTGDIPRKESYKKYLETGTSLLEIIKMIKPYDMEGTKIIFPGGKNSINSQDGALIVVDGQQMGTDASVLSGLNPHDIDEINVSTQPMDIQRYTGLNSVGLIEIKTKRGEITKPAPEELSLAARYEGDYRIPRIFGVSEKTGMRTTAWWDGRLFIDESGKASLQIPGPNVVSRFIIKAEGMGGNGKFGHAEKSITITE
ncbi:MAG: hypothetical protein RBS73_17905 [Prolixibacteraceae bacterium]|jgi:hypothetical protein|nr:hypothetical protein [Prolixibacteraceae bacterium]